VNIVSLVKPRVLLALCLFGVFALLGGGRASAQSQEIVSWGENMPGWSKKLGLTALREGCTDTPAHCAVYVTNLAIREGVSRVYVSIPLSISSAASSAAEYSSQSLAYPKIVEVGFDDFVNDIENAEIAGTLSDPGSLVTSVITALKSKNPNLKFGVTVYEDSLSHLLITSSTWSNAGISYKSIPASVLAKIDNVHLFVHYRESASTYATSVATAKRLFPNAKIIAGAYPYDRIDYTTCAYKGTTHCTAAQEQTLFEQLTTTQAGMVKAGTVSGLEFFFGYFGDPQDWPGWVTQTRVCNPTRYAQCYANSDTLQNMSVSILQTAFSSTAVPQVTTQYSSVYMGSEPVGKEGTPGKISLKNSGSGALAISEIVVAGTNAADFPMTHNCGSSLAASAGCTLTVYFRPAAVGSRAGQIIVYDNAGSGRQTINLTGTGTAGSSGTPGVTLQYPSVFMGNEFVGVQGTPGKIWIKNSGTAALAISRIAVSGTNAADFTLVNGCGSSLAPAAFCTLSVYFKPGALGSRSAKITLTDNAGSGTQSVALTGTGISK